MEGKRILHERIWKYQPIEDNSSPSLLLAAANFTDVVEVSELCLLAHDAESTKRLYSIYI